MGKAGRRKGAALEFETFNGAGCSCGLKLELAAGNESGYAGVFPTTSSKWQAVIRVEREGKKVRRNVGSFETKENAAVQRALALQGSVGVQSPAHRAERTKGMRFTHHPLFKPSVSPPCVRCCRSEGDNGGDVLRNFRRDQSERALRCPHPAPMPSCAGCCACS